MEIGLQILGVVLALLGAFGIVFEAFSVSLLWGMISLLLAPIGTSVFISLHWRLVRKPFLIHVFGLGLILAGRLLISD